MDKSLRHAWTTLIAPADLDDHMHRVGQAAANAALMQSMLDLRSAKTTTKLLLVGGGTAQFLDYISAANFEQFDITISDINGNFLDCARERFAQAGLQRVKFVIDDIEATHLRDSFDTIVVVLVLEHIDWQRGAHAIHRLAPDTIHIVIQKMLWN